MKHIVITTALALVLVGTFTSAHAQEEKKKRPELTEEQKALMKQMTEKYDADKDGKLSPDERGKMSQEDKDKLAKAGIGGRGPGGKGKGDEKKKE